MKNYHPLLLLLVLCITTVSSCKKDDNNTNNNNNNNTNNPLGQALGGSPTIPSGSAGALYAVNNYVISDDGFGGNDTTELGTAYAWFDNYTTTKDAGAVTCNSVDVLNSFSGTALPWYYTIGDYVDFTTATTAAWAVAGNSGNSITGFNYTDNTAFPKCNFNVPATINRDNSLTVTCTNTTTNDAVFFTIYGQGTPKVTKAMNANATSATFSSAEVKSVVSSGGLIGIQVMPVRLNPQTINGKTYYFVKQWAFARFATAL